MRDVVEPYTGGYEAVDDEPYRSSHAEIQDFVRDRTITARSEVGR